MTTIATDLGETDGVVHADETTEWQAWYSVDDEVIKVVGLDYRDPTSWVVLRGEAGTIAAAHSQGATLTRYYPDAPAVDAVDNPLTGPLDAGGQAITNAAEPSDAHDLATKNYVDARGLAEVLDSGAVVIATGAENANASYVAEADGTGNATIVPQAIVAGASATATAGMHAENGAHGTFVDLSLTAGAVATLAISGLPTSDPHIADAVYVAAGVLKLSAG